MARPKLGETDTERLHVKITSDEIAAIDDWRYLNRIPSRSEAVRRLCQIGLLVGGELEGLTDNVVELSSALNTIDEQTSNLWLEMASPVLPGESLDREKVAARVEILLSNIAQVAGGLDDVASIAVALHRATTGFSRAESLAQGKSQSAEIISDTNEFLHKMRSLRDEREENQRQLAEYGYRKPRKDEDKK